LRVISHTDIDGNVYVADRRLRPFQFPITSLGKKLEHYKKQETNYTHYDPDLGWAIRPSSQSENGLYFSNSSGVRTSSSRQETPPQPLPGTFRIAIFGDSFTHGDDVPYEETWGAVLEKTLLENGRQVEVINLGGQGYAIDQAFLRWRKHGKLLQPHLVLFGFQNSNVKRTMNLIRTLYSPDTDIIFSKPRFIVKNDMLHLINVPTAAPEDLVSIFKNFQNWELKDQEFFYQESNYEDSPIYRSRLASFIISGVMTKFSSRRKGYDFFAHGSKSRTIVWRIIEEFKREVEEKGGRFMIVHLPTKKPIIRLRNEQRLKYQNLLEELKANYELIDPSPELIHKADISSFDDLFSDRSSHYSTIGNQVIGETIANALLSH
ncbi:MAG: SGNH/GDSL hydrolase family protein, partial [Nitrospirae bacterium]|nr:SGNH/GDSL hydrolase family protein [Nitrospirota bacterium]